MDSANRSSKLHLVEATSAEVAGRDLDPHSKIKQALELNGCFCDASSRDRRYTAGRKEMRRIYSNNHHCPPVSLATSIRFPGFIGVFRAHLESVTAESMLLIRPKHRFQVLSRRICSGGAGEGALPICSYSAITWAPNISKVDASSKLSKTTMAVVSDP